MAHSALFDCTNRLNRVALLITPLSMGNSDLWDTEITPTELSYQKECSALPASLKVQVNAQKCGVQFFLIWLYRALELFQRAYEEEERVWEYPPERFSPRPDGIFLGALNRDVLNVNTKAPSYRWPVEVSWRARRGWVGIASTIEIAAVMHRPLYGVFFFFRHSKKKRCSVVLFSQFLWVLSSDPRSTWWRCFRPIVQLLLYCVTGMRRKKEFCVE